MKLSHFLFLILALTLASCSSTSKLDYTEEEIESFKSWVETNDIEILPRWANPLATQSINSIASAGLLPPGSSPNRIDIIGTTSYLQIKKDSVFARLPYYGERQFGHTYNPQDVGINFESVPTDFEMTFNEKKQAYDFSFDVQADSGESFNINGTLFPNRNTSFYVNSNQRLTIGYSGNFSVPEEIQNQ